MVNISTLPIRKPSKVEGLKERSNFLREPVASELLLDTTHFSEDAIQILKFHGSYQQDDRDNRIKGQEKDYQFMLRTRNPGGFIPPELYLALDQLADEYGNHTLRATTRQGFQLHGILKKNLKAAIAAIVHNLGSTLGACGDLNRNVMAPVAPYKNRPEYQYAWDYANGVADLLTPQAGAYYEIWLDGEKAISAEEDPAVVAARQRNGNGTIVHLTTEYFKAQSDTYILHIPYRGTALAIPDLVSGKVDVLFDSFVTGMPHVKVGKLRALAVTSAKRSALAPDMPTVAEVLPGFESVTWFGVYGPKNMPADLTTKVNQAVNAALADADVKERFARLGAEPAGGTPQAFAAMVKADNAKWKKIIADRKISVE